jgi:hypothetical protein
VGGNLYTPRSGVGTCTAGAVTGLTTGGSATVNGSMVQLPKAVTYPAPVFSTTPPTTSVTIGSTPLAITTCTNPPALGGLGLTAANCSVSGTTLTINGGGADVTLPSVVVASGYTLIINGTPAPGQTVNINSLSGTGNVQFNYSGVNPSVILKIAGKNPDGTDMATPFDLTQLGSWQQNNTATANYDASALQIVYGGPATISMKGGNSQSAATIYAPNATFTLQGTQDLYGSILAKTISNGGNASIHYDRRLSRGFYVAGQPMMGTFSWVRAQ